VHEYQIPKVGVSHSQRQQPKLEATQESHTHFNPELIMIRGNGNARQSIAMTAVVVEKSRL
jgi:hypothetical protein